MSKPTRQFIDDLLAASVAINSHACLSELRNEIDLKLDGLDG